MKRRWMGAVLLAAVLLSGCYPTTYVELSGRESVSPGTTEASIQESREEAQTADTRETTSTEAPESTSETRQETPSVGSSPSQTTKPPEPQPTADKPGATGNTKPATVPAETEATAPPETEETLPTEPDVYDIYNHTIGSLEYAIVQEINNQRSQAGLSALEMDSIICALGSIQGYEYTLGISPSSGILSSYGYGYRAADCHLQTFDAGFSNGDMAWMWTSFCDSGVYLNPDYTTVGVGTYTVNGTVYISGIFMG